MSIEVDYMDEFRSLDWTYITDMYSDIEEEKDFWCERNWKLCITKVLSNIILIKNEILQLLFAI